MSPTAATVMVVPGGVAVDDSGATDDVEDPVGAGMSEGSLPQDNSEAVNAATIGSRSRRLQRGRGLTSGFRCPNVDLITRTMLTRPGRKYSVRRLEDGKEFGPTEVSEAAVCGVPAVDVSATADAS